MVNVFILKRSLDNTVILKRPLGYYS
jgi:hypothetical protein